MNKFYTLLCILSISTTLMFSQSEKSDSSSVEEAVSSFLGFLGPKIGVVAKADAEIYDDGNSTQNSFNVTAFRVYLKGNSEDRFSYSFYGDFTSGYKLLDLKFTYKITGDVKVEAGQFKTPFGIEFPLLDAKLLFVNRSMVNTLLGPLRQVGVSVQGSMLNKRLSLTGGIFNGTTSNNDKPKISLFIGNIKTSPIKIDGNGKTIIWEAGASIAIRGQDGDLYSTSTLTNDKTQYGFNTRFIYNNNWIEGEYLAGRDENGISQDGFYINAGRKINDQWEIATRFDYFMFHNLYPNIIVSSAQAPLNRKYWLGINAYLVSNIKIQANIGRDFTQEQTWGYLSIQYAINFE